MGSLAPLKCSKSQKFPGSIFWYNTCRHKIHNLSVNRVKWRFLLHIREESIVQSKTCWLSIIKNGQGHCLAQGKHLPLSWSIIGSTHLQPHGTGSNSDSGWTTNQTTAISRSVNTLFCSGGAQRSQIKGQGAEPLWTDCWHLRKRKPQSQNRQKQQRGKNKQKQKSGFLIKENNNKQTILWWQQNIRCVTTARKGQPQRRKTTTREQTTTKNLNVKQNQRKNKKTATKTQNKEKWNYVNKRRGCKETKRGIRTDSKSIQWYKKHKQQTTTTHKVQQRDEWVQKKNYKNTTINTKMHKNTSQETKTCQVWNKWQSWK